MSKAESVEEVVMPAGEEELLDVILEEIRRAAEEEAQRIIKEAEEEAKKIVEEARKKAEELRREKIQRMIYERKAAVEREIAPRRLEIRRKYIREKYSLLFKAFDEAVSEAVSNLKNSGDYDDFLVNGIVKALSEISSDKVIVHPVPGDKRRVSSALKEALKRINGRKIEAKIGDTIEAEGGVFVESTDGREYFNATIDAKKIELRERVLPELATEVMGGLG